MNSGYGSMLDSVLHIVWFNNQNNKPTYKLTNYTKTDWEKTLVNNQGHLTISHPFFTSTEWLKWHKDTGFPFLFFPSV